MDKPNVCSIQAIATNMEFEKETGMNKFSKNKKNEYQPKEPMKNWHTEWQLHQPEIFLQKKNIKKMKAHFYFSQFALWNKEETLFQAKSPPFKRRLKTMTAPPTIALFHTDTCAHRHWQRTFRDKSYNIFKVSSFRFLRIRAKKKKWANIPVCADRL